MDINQRGLLLKEEVYQVVGCAFEVQNTLGHGLLEKSYENALVVECGLRGIPVSQQRRIDVYYKQVKVGDYMPDLIVFDKIIVETKTIDRIGNHERGQVINYLRISGLQVGIVLNFKHAKLEWERVAV